MDIPSLLTPWAVLAAVLIPIIYLENWIQSHLYGMGWLMTNNEKSATALYYVLLFPGVFVHEFVQYLLAGALNVRIKRMIAWPEAQKDGTLRLDFVQIQKAHRIQAAIIGAAPLIVGTALIYLISNHVLSLGALVDAITAWDSGGVQSALQDLTTTPDFYLWLYMILALSNTMLPTPADRQGWPLLAAIFAGIIGLLLILGADQGVLLATYENTVVSGLEIMTAALAAVLVVEIPAVFLIGLLEEVLERTTGRKFEYVRAPGQRRNRRSRSAKRPAGSALPLEPGQMPPSIYDLELPIPDPADRDRLVAQARRARTSQDSRSDFGQQPAAQRRPAGTQQPAGPARSPMPDRTTSARPDPANPRPASPGDVNRQRPPAQQPHRSASPQHSPDDPRFRQPGTARPDRAGPQPPRSPGREPGYRPEQAPDRARPERDPRQFQRPPQERGRDAAPNPTQAPRPASPGDFNGPHPPPHEQAARPGPTQAPRPTANRPTANRPPGDRAAFNRPNEADRLRRSRSPGSPISGAYQYNSDDEEENGSPGGDPQELEYVDDDDIY